MSENRALKTLKHYITLDHVEHARGLCWSKIILLDLDAFGLQITQIHMTNKDENDLLAYQ